MTTVTALLHLHSYLSSPPRRNLFKQREPIVTKPRLFNPNTYIKTNLFSYSSSSFTLNSSNTNGPAELTSTSSAKIRSEVLTPFRSLRMFFYLAFIASGSLGALIAITRFISFTLKNSSSDEIIEILQGLGIDLVAVSIFAYLYYTENKAKNAQIARLSREENLSKLKLRISKNKVVSVNSLRGIARLVIVVGSKDFIADAFKRSREYTKELIERGVLVVPFAVGGEELPEFEFEEGDENKRLWQLVPVNTWEWSRWLNEQKKLANVSPDSPVYMSLRLDGRVRGSGVGYPPWNAFVAQLPPVKGLWSGLLDGMDGRVL